jgi:chromosome segregation ATPase
MKGFKSFADSTTIEFEPGVTAVVGPNGSGKSNVVDAVIWVLGAQGTKVLRSAKMDDVIFAGTTNKAALGRAEVSLTLDNSDGRLSIDGAEVTISRTLFRNGDSEYAINGTTCRLLDIQELLSDSGVGRNQHMIIGQGQLDSILQSTPEHRRSVIEEAAGVSIHRRRKERSERRLAQTQENLERLGDLVREVRRQMRPLERQAQSARSFAEVEAELRAARHSLFSTRAASFETRQIELGKELAEFSSKEQEVRNEILTLDARASATASEMASRREETLASTLGTLQGLAERARGTASIIQERERSLKIALIASADENVIATLEADAAKLESDLVGLGAEEAMLSGQREALESVRNELKTAENDFVTAWGAGSGDDLELLNHEISRLGELIAELENVVNSMTNDSGELSGQVVLINEELNALRAQLPVLEQAVNNAAEHRAVLDEARENLEGQRNRVGDLATELLTREVEFAERRRLIEQRQNEIEQRLEGRSTERAEAASRRESLEFDLQVLERLAALVTRASNEIRTSQEAMDSTYREQLEASRAGAERLEEVRRARSNAEGRLSELSELVRSREIEQAELAIKTTNLHELIKRDLGILPHELGAPTRIDLPEGVSLEQRVGELEARITSLGPINPLALEELTVLEERYKELDAQVTDVRNARRELQEVIRAVDKEIMDTFSSAAADVNEHFSTLISSLFPGGHGRLVLTDPEDPLNTGIEIELRPMGQNVRRMSLLSGGQRSIAALAFLFAIFRSRPSPFYMLDEVEAALDDVNLQRFLGLVDEFRDEAQLLIVTHQKRTMESADALYGVTMVPGSSSKVVSQRVKRNEGVTTS